MNSLDRYFTKLSGSNARKNTFIFQDPVDMFESLFGLKKLGETCCRLNAADAACKDKRLVSTCTEIMRCMSGYGDYHRAYDLLWENAHLHRFLGEAIRYRMRQDVDGDRPYEMEFIDHVCGYFNRNPEAFAWLAGTTCNQLIDVAKSDLTKRR